MREVSTDEITKNIKEMCIEANYILSDDAKNKIINSAAVENSEIGKKIYSLFHLSNPAYFYTFRYAKIVNN